MPQVILEYSANIIEKDDVLNLLKKLHLLLVELLPADLNSCKSRVLEHQRYYLGDGDPSNAFVHIQLKVMKGRSEEILMNTGEKTMLLLKDFFVESHEIFNLQLSVEIDELQKTYFKN